MNEFNKIYHVEQKVYTKGLDKLLFLIKHNLKYI